MFNPQAAVWSEPVISFRRLSFKLEPPVLQMTENTWEFASSKDDQPAQFVEGVDGVPKCGVSTLKQVSAGGKLKVA